MIEATNNAGDGHGIKSKRNKSPHAAKSATGLTNDVDLAVCLLKCTCLSCQVHDGLRLAMDGRFKEGNSRVRLASNKLNCWRALEIDQRCSIRIDQIRDTPIEESIWIFTSAVLVNPNRARLRGAGQIQASTNILGFCFKFIPKDKRDRNAVFCSSVGTYLATQPTIISYSFAYFLRR